MIVAVSCIKTFNNDDDLLKRDGGTFDDGLLMTSVIEWHEDVISHAKDP